eukprot:gene15119-33364_t
MRLFGLVAQGFGLLAAVTAVAGAAEVYTVVDLTGKADGSKKMAPLPTQVSVLACSGLYNRKVETDGGGTGTAEYPAVSVDPFSIATPIPEFLESCLKKTPSTRSGMAESAGAGASSVAKGYIRYNASAQKAAFPSIITVAGVLDAIPLEDGNPAIAASGAPMLLDALQVYAGMSEHDAVQYTYNNYRNGTTTMSKMNPGYADQSKKPFDPPLTGNPNPGLVDFIVKERLFNFYLNLGCVPGTKDHVLEAMMAKEGPWPKPIRVYGYDNTIPVAGDLFEAETDCNREHNMGQVASDGLNNLAFYSRKPAVTTP